MCRLFALAVLFTLSAQAADLGMATCRGNFQQGQSSWRRQVLFQGQAFSLWNASDRYEQNYYDMNEYQVLPSGNIRGERKGSSSFNEFHYVVEASRTMVKLWEISIPHYNRVKITHFAECVLDRPLTVEKFEGLKRDVLL